ncbi:hypothetical protein LBMAG27_21410 [Bacteroidota bacterium]|nr:hypothetical protein LBMAG27_21410 [Bacteroidota bacterium]
MKKIFLLASLVLSLNAIAQVPSYIPTTGLVAWYPFNGNANDGSGNALNGIVTNAILSTDRFGNANQSYDFYYSGARIEVPWSSLLFPDTITVSGWFNTPTGSNGGGAILRSGNGSTDSWKGYYFHSDGSTIDSIPLYYKDMGGGGYRVYNYLATQYAHRDIWNFFTVVRTPSTLQLYLNGQPAGTLTGLLPYDKPTSTPLIFGNNHLPFDVHFEGRLDDIGIWNRALTQQEITALYTGCNTCTTPTNITVASITGSKATISWTGNSCAAKYRVRYRVQGTTSWVTKIVTAPVSSKILTLLQPLTTYEFQVRTDCNSTGTIASAYSTIQTFTTICDCTKPTNIAVSNVTQTGATVSWLGNLCAVKYRLQYRIQGTTTWTTKTINAPTLFYTIIGLTNNTIYEYHLRSDCNSTGTVNSGWTTTATITTPLRMENSEISSSTFYVSPNPCSTCFVNGIMDEQDLIVTDILGRKINVQFTKSENGFYINLAENSKGIFIIRNKKTGEVVKFVKE